MGRGISMVSGKANLSSKNYRNSGYILPFGAQSMVLPGNVLLSDPFDGATIDLNRWTAPVLAGGGTVTQASGVLTIATGTTVSNAGALSSIHKMQPVGAGFLAFGSPIQFEAAPSTNTHRFFGYGTPNASFTAATPMADAYGWELDITGALNCVTYSGNARTIWGTRAPPTDGAPHILVAYPRADAVYFHFDDLEEYFAVGGYQQASTSALPVRMHCINHTIAPAIAPTFKSYGVASVDLSNNYQPIFNGQFIEARRDPNIYIPLNAVSVASEANLWVPASGRRFRLQGGLLTSGTVGGNVALKDGTGGTVIIQVPFGAASAPLPFTLPGNGKLSAAINNPVTGTGVATQTVSGYLFGCEE